MSACYKPIPAKMNYNLPSFMIMKKKRYNSFYQRFRKFEMMQTHSNIEFEQLVQLVKELPASQWAKLKTEVDAQKQQGTRRDAFRDFLLNGPTYSQEQLDEVAAIRKRNDAWRAA